MSGTREDRSVAAAHSLPPVLDGVAASALREECLGRIGGRRAILLDGTDVTRAGLASLQVLAAARIAAAEAGLAYAVADPSAPLREMASVAGLCVALEPVG